MYNEFPFPPPFFMKIIKINATFLFLFSILKTIDEDKIKDQIESRFINPCMSHILHSFLSYLFTSLSLQSKGKTRDIHKS